MGLDITAYSNIRIVARLVKSERGSYDADWHGTLYVWPSDNDLHRADDLEIGAIYKYDDEFRFRAGSYGGYNQWRDTLSRLVLGVSPDTVWSNEAEFQDKPFVGLIHFSDCEGIIGPAWCAKLAKDFADYQYLVDAMPETDENTDWFKDKYADWRKAFELAANGGAVEFH